MKEVKTVLELIALNKVQFTTKITAPTPPRKQRGRQIKSSSRTITESNDSEPKRQNRRGPRRQDSDDHSDQSPSSSDSLSDLDSEESDSKFLSKLEQTKKPQKLLTKRQRMALEKEEADSQELERLDQQFF